MKCILFSNYDLSEKTDLFFSTTWCRDRLFTSDNLNDIMKFYGTFSDREELTEWMRERPKGGAYFHEVEGDKDVIVVIPTAEFGGKYARECRENIFSGLHIIFVESGEIPDPYFNYAHNCNVGIKKALEYNPEWIVVSNDDMVKIDDVGVLRKELMKVESDKVDIVLARESRNHSTKKKIAKYGILFFLYFWLTNNLGGRNLLKLYKKFGVEYLIGPQKGIISRFFKRGYNYTEIQDFGIFSANWARKNNGYIFDETFLSSTEDTDLSLRASLFRKRISISDYAIDSKIGGSIGAGTVRSLRDVAGLAYLNKKWSFEPEGIQLKNSRFKPKRDDVDPSLNVSVIKGREEDSLNE